MAGSDAELRAQRVECDEILSNEKPSKLQRHLNTKLQLTQVDIALF